MDCLTFMRTPFCSAEQCGYEGDGAVGGITQGAQPVAESVRGVRGLFEDPPCREGDESPGDQILLHSVLHASFQRGQTV
jgi:hypothetical protein